MPAPAHMEETARILVFQMLTERMERRLDLERFSGGGGEQGGDRAELKINQ